MEAKDSFTLTWCNKHRNWSQSDCPECMVNSNEEDIERAGMRKVVEWIRNGTVMQVPRGTRVYRADKEKVLVQFDYTEWQAKLKEWGLETS